MGKNEDFIKNHDENSNEIYIFEIDVEYPKKLFNLHKDLPFLAERKKTEKLTKKIDKEKYVVHIRASLKTSTKSWINTKKSTQSNSI